MTLGTLSEFKKKYSDPIAKGKAPGASSKAVSGGKGDKNDLTFELVVFLT